MNPVTVSRHVLILVLSGSSMMTCASVIDPLRAANRLSRMSLFTWSILAIDGKPIMLTCGIELPNDGLLSSQSKADLLVVIAGFEHQRYASTKQLVSLKSLAQDCKTVFGVEAGTWLLARAGIISKHKVTTHWEDLELLTEQFSDLEVSSQRYVIDRDIWTCSGATPAFEMMLQYLRTIHNQSLALDVANVFIYAETSSASDEQASISLGRLQQVEPRLVQAIRLMETHFEDTISSKTIADNIGISLRTLEQISLKYLGFTPAKYYLRLRLQRARRLVLDSNLPILEIAVRCGFNSLTAFSRAFKARYNYSPTQLRSNLNGA
ncbi:MAG: transcriptional regulator GlxA family with amidase domain [Arenicella sp.]|jgi:transcriptional regulator GlxA family with amidase domain